MGSRKEFNNEKFRFVVGVDHVTSAFFEIWNQPADDQDQPLVMANNQGVRVAIDEETGEKVTLDSRLQRLVNDLDKRFKSCGNSYPNLQTEHIVPFSEWAAFGNMANIIEAILD